MIQIRLSTNIIIPKLYNGFRVRHKVEGGWDKTPLGMPEVIPPTNSVALYMTEAIQKMSYQLMTLLNKAITPKQWTMVHGDDVAFCNGTGFEGDTPRCNYITGQNLDCELPRYDKAQRLCGGSFVTGKATFRNGEAVLICRPGVDGIDANQPLPDVATIIRNNWYFHAVSMDTLVNISHFPQGSGGIVLMPFIFDREIMFPLSCFQPWEADTLPDPLKIYDAKL